METQPHCPRCRSALRAKRTGVGIHYECSACGGRSVALSIARRKFDAGVLKNLWLSVKDAPPVRDREALDCPYCRSKMHPLALEDGTSGFQIDVCRPCQAIWLDATESERLPVREGGEKDHFLPNGYAAAPDAKDSLHRARVEAIRAAESTGVPQRADPDSIIDAVMTYFGFPIEEDQPPRSGRHWVTWSLIAVCVGVFLLEITGAQVGLVEKFGYKPIYGALSPMLLTAFFLHGGILHLLGNMWFLHMVGDNVESRLGPVRYFLLVMAATAAGALAHGLLEPQSRVPLIGASAGISGLMVYYALCWPKSRLLIGLRVSLFPFWFSMGAAWAAVFWLGLQILGAFLQVAGVGNVSYLGHLGGAGVGLLAFFLPKWVGFRPGPRAGDFSDPNAVARQKQK